MANSLRLEQFPFAQVGEWLSDGAIVPFVGAGASQGGEDCLPRLPDGPGLAAELVEIMEGAFPSGGASDLAKVAQYYEHSVFDRAALYDYLHRRFETEQRPNPPSRVAQLLAATPSRKPMFIVTTNYDSFIERAFAAEDRSLCVVTQNMRDPERGASVVEIRLPDGTTAQEESTQFQWSDPARFPSDCAFLFKMHGSTHRGSLNAPDDVIITEDDYVDFMVNVGGSVSPFFPPASLTAVYKQRRFLFLGYSLYDWNFRAFLRILALRNALSGREARRHWAIQSQPENIEVDLWSHRNVNVFDGDLVEFCDRLTATRNGGSPA